MNSFTLLLSSVSLASLFIAEPAHGREPQERLQELMNSFASPGWRFTVASAPQPCILQIRSVANGDHLHQIPLRLMDPSSVNWSNDDRTYKVECTGEKDCVKVTNQGTGQETAEMEFSQIVANKTPDWVRREIGDILKSFVVKCGGKADRKLRALRMLSVSIENCDLQGVKSALKDGANPNTAPRGDFPLLPLYTAINKCNLDIVQTLLKKGAILRRDSDRAPLHFVSDVEVAKMLLARGYAVSDLDDNGETPLHRSALLGRGAIVELLLSRKADPHARTRYGDTALHLAAQSGDERSVTLLLDAGVPPNARNDDGETPLYRAPTPAAAKKLLDHGADPLMKAKNGKTPLTFHREILSCYEKGECTGAEDWERAEATLKVLETASSESPGLAPPLRDLGPPPVQSQPQGCRVDSSPVERWLLIAGLLLVFRRERRQAPSLHRCE